MLSRFFFVVSVSRRGDSHAYWVCAARETPIFSPKFPFRSISFSQIFSYSAPEHHHFTVFAVPETIIFNISLPTADFLSRAPQARSGAPHFHTRATRARSGEVHSSLCRGAPRLAAGQNASQTRPTVRSGDRHFHA